MLRDNYENVKEYINGKLGSINDSDYILLDVEEADKIDDLLEIVFEYKLRNVTPIIVSPEKIKEIIKDKNILQSFQSIILINSVCSTKRDIKRS